LADGIVSPGNCLLFGQGRASPNRGITGIGLDIAAAKAYVLSLFFQKTYQPPLFDIVNRTRPDRSGALPAAGMEAIRGMNKVAAFLS